MQTERFYVGQELVERLEGQPVHPSLMKSWRALRESDPGAFGTLRVWQQPAAVMDGVLWRWQLETDGSEHRQILRVTDSLGVVWSEQSREAAWLLNQLQCCVGAGQTPLQQPTDSHLAKGAKDAARREEERLRQLMRMAAVKEGRQAEYHSGPREILSVALAMHTGMEELNVDRKIVLQAAFQTGWLAWRPGVDGRLVSTSSQDWTSQWKMGCGRLSPAHLRNRQSWLDNDGVPMLADTSTAAGQKGLPVADCLLEDQTGLPLQPDENDMVLQDVSGDWLTQSEQATATSAVVAPSARLFLEHLPAQTQAEMEKLSVRQLWQKRSDREAKRMRQTEKAAKKAAILVAVNAEKKEETQAERWARQTKEAGGAEKRLQALQPASTNKKHQKYNAKRSQCRKGAGSKAKKTARRDAHRELLAKSRLARQVKKKAQAVRAAKRKAGVLEGEPAQPMTGKKVRMVGFSLTDLLRNSQATVLAQHADTLVLETVSKGIVNCGVDEVYEQTGSERLPLPDELRLPAGQPSWLQTLKLDCRRQAGSDLEKVKPNQLLQDSDLQAAWCEIQARRMIAGDKDFESQAVFIQPARGKWLVDAWKTAPGSPDTQEALDGLRQQLREIVARDRQAGCIFWPVHNSQADHWTLLTLFRRPQPDGAAQSCKWEVQYRDSLRVPAQSSKKLAQAALAVLREAMGESVFAHSSLVMTASAKQAGNSECGFFVMCWVEEAVRQLRGEGVHRLSTRNFSQMAARITKWSQSVMTAYKSSQKTAVKAEKAAAVSSVEDTEISKAVKKEPLQVVVVDQPVLGCSKCRYSKSGCLSCCPVKAYAYWHKKDSQNSQK